jgi:hypothetical protein
MQTITDRFKIVELTEHAQLNRQELEQLLKILPISFETVDESIPPNNWVSSDDKNEVMEVYHDAGVVNLYPPNGSRLYNACLYNMDFPIRPDNIMNDTLGLRCCFHPKVSSFGINPRTCHGDSIEIDIHKYSRENRYGNGK